MSDPATATRHQPQQKNLMNDQHIQRNTAVAGFQGPGQFTSKTKAEEQRPTTPKSPHAWQTFVDGFDRRIDGAAGVFSGPATSALDWRDQFHLQLDDYLANSTHPDACKLADLLTQAVDKRDPELIDLRTLDPQVLGGVPDELLDTLKGHVAIPLMPGGTAGPLHDRWRATLAPPLPLKRRASEQDLSPAGPLKRNADAQSPVFGDPGELDLPDLHDFMALNPFDLLDDADAANSPLAPDPAPRRKRGRPVNARWAGLPVQDQGAGTRQTYCLSEWQSAIIRTRNSKAIELMTRHPDISVTDLDKKLHDADTGPAISPVKPPTVRKIRQELNTMRTASEGGPCATIPAEIYRLVKTRPACSNAEIANLLVLDRPATTALIKGQLTCICDLARLAIEKNFLSGLPGTSGTWTDTHEEAARLLAIWQLVTEKGGVTAAEIAARLGEPENTQDAPRAPIWKCLRTAHQMFHAHCLYLQQSAEQPNTDAGALYLLLLRNPGLQDDDPRIVELLRQRWDPEKRRPTHEDFEFYRRFGLIAVLRNVFTPPPAAT